MKFMTSDPRIKDSFEIAKEKGIEYKFVKKNLGSKYHPNTVKIVLENDQNKMSVIGSSIGGGMMEIIKLDNFNINLKGRAGKYLSLVAMHDKNPKVIPELVRKLKAMDMNVVNIEHSSFRNKTLSVLSLEGNRITLPQIIELEK